MTDRQTVLIAGATGNVGGGAATALGNRGAQVVLLGRRSETLEATAESIRSRRPETQRANRDEDVATLVVDLSDMEAVREAAAEAMNRFPKIHGLILSAGALLQDGPTILPNGHEVMFATNVMGPFLFTQLLLDRLEESNGLVLHVVAPFYEAIDWDDLESIKNHKTGTAYNRTKTMNRMIAAELARRHGDEVSSVAFNPGFVIDKDDPELAKRWPTGFRGFYWRVMTSLVAKAPSVAGEPIADLMMTHPDPASLNGALFKLDKRVKKPDKAMNDVPSAQKLWSELVRTTTGPTTTEV